MRADATVEAVSPPSAAAGGEGGTDLGLVMGLAGGHLRSSLPDLCDCS